MSTPQALDRFLEWDGISRLEQILSARRGSNFFHIAPRLLRVEGVHSDLLAWLLDPDGWHGLGESFVAPFVSELLRDARADVPGALTGFAVSKEFSTGHGPIDVLVRARSDSVAVVVGLENKIDAPLGDDQLERYARGLVASTQGAVVVLVLLAPEERDVALPRVEGCAFAVTTYRRLAFHLNVALAGRSGGAGMELARHYLEALRTSIVPEPQPEVDDILRELFTTHGEAWRFIRRRLPSERDEHHARLATTL
jgi:hypothetical protein